MSIVLLMPHDVAAGAAVVEEAVDGVRQVLLPHIRREVAKGALELPKVRAQPHLPPAPSVRQSEIG